MKALPIPGSLAVGPKNLLRLVYLDEAGTTSGASWIAVAGVIVHGDQQWRDVDVRLAALIEKHIPEADRRGFVFHATDIFHGSRYFDRRNPRWKSRERRWAILEDLAQVIADLSLPVVMGSVDKRPYIESLDLSTNNMHMWSALNCLYWADLWLNAFAPDEMATVVHEDGAAAKPYIKELVRACRYPEQLPEFGSLSLADAYGLPFEHLIDTVHFVEKADARLLQLADLCAFMIGRSVQGRSVCDYVMQVIEQGTAWSREFRPAGLPDREASGF
jgi:hypothetical protein